MKSIRASSVNPLEVNDIPNLPPADLMHSYVVSCSIWDEKRKVKGYNNKYYSYRTGQSTIKIYFPSSDIFVSSFSEPSGVKNKNKISERGKLYPYCTSNIR